MKKKNENKEKKTPLTLYVFDPCKIFSCEEWHAINLSDVWEIDTAVRKKIEKMIKGENFVWTRILYLRDGKYYINAERKSLGDVYIDSGLVCVCTIKSNKQPREMQKFAHFNVDWQVDEYVLDRDLRLKSFKIESDGKEDRVTLDNWNEINSIIDEIMAECEEDEDYYY